MPAKKKPAPRKTPARKPAPKPPGRPSGYSDALADRICAQLADGTSLIAVCQQADMPGRSTVMRWLAEDMPKRKPNTDGFRDKYARAREAQAEFYAEQIIDIADEDAAVVMIPAEKGEDGEMVPAVAAFDSAAVSRNKLRVDARKWLASKLAPKKYGDKLAVGQADDLEPLQVVVKKYAA